MFIFHQVFISSTLLIYILTFTYAQQNSNATAALNNTIIKGNNSLLKHVIATNQSVTNSSLIDTQFMEGGKLDVKNSTVNKTNEATRPYGRENVTEKPDKSTPINLVTKTAPINATTEKVIPISENISSEYFSEKLDHKKTVPKKGVKFPDEVLKQSSTTASTSTTTMPTSTTQKPKKPLFTVGNSDEPFAPSHFVSSKSKNVSSIPKVPSIESYANQSKNGSDYIVPIVGVILSVPLVAILMNVIYKKTKEWWHHRHYSRMDFLIDGMYNN